MQLIFNNNRNTLNAARHVIYFLIIVANIAQFSHRVFSARSKFFGKWKALENCLRPLHELSSVCLFYMCACVLGIYCQQVQKIKWVFHICMYAGRHTLYTLDIYICIYKLASMEQMTVGLSHLFRLLNSILRVL